MNQRTILGSQLGKWITLAVLVAVLATLLTASVVRAQEDSTTIEYAENGTDPVVTLTATDPDEGDMITWMVESTGAEDFTISDDGALTFISPPDYESPMGGDGNDDNTYEVTVEASDGKAANGMAETTFAADDEFVVTVKVTDAPESEKLTWAITGPTLVLMQFEVGAVLTASVSGGDISTEKELPSSSPRVKWYRSSSKTSQRMAIEDATNAAYTVQDDDVGYYLHAEAHYNVGNDLEQSLSLTSDYPVLATRDPDTAPTFPTDDINRMVNEGAKGMPVGDPVTATDDGPGKLNYALGGSDMDKFDIDQKTGQITTEVDLDYEAGAGTADQCRQANACVVTVTATDSAGTDSSAKTVNIMLVNLDDEKPTFTNAATLLSTVTPSEGETALTTGDLANVTFTATDPDGGNIRLDLRGADVARFDLSGGAVGFDVLSFRTAPDYEMPTDANKDNVYEVTVRASDGTMYADHMVKVTVTNINEEPMISTGLSMNRDYAENGTDPVITLSATDPDEGDMIVWMVSSTGTEDFTISDDGALTFNSPPDYESPMGGGNDNENTYEVTVEASDGKNDAGMAETTFAEDDTFVVTVKVTDVPEAEKLSWTLVLMQFEVGAVLTASVSGGDISIAKPVDYTGWQWYRSGTTIEDATNAAYTVHPDDSGHHIRVKVEYRVGDGRQEPSLSLTSDYPVLATRDPDTAPTFPTDDINRMVNEGAKGMPVGDPVTATDDGPGKLNYALGGSDMDKFDIDQKTGQITTEVDLDYEAGAGTADQCRQANACVVTVTATDSAGTDSSAKTVNIMLVNLDDEKPTFTNAATLLSTITLPEGETALTTGDLANVTFTATDPDGNRVNLELQGADVARFDLSGVDVLSFRTAPDYEMPTDMNKDNMYEVTVRASDGTMYAERKVTVTITSINEAPMILPPGLTVSGLGSWNYPEIGTDAVGTYRASGAEAASARWTLAGDDSGDFSLSSNSGATTMLRFRSVPDFETPKDMDTNNTYEVTVKATDRSNNMDTRDVTVTVDNVEELGTVTLSPMSPVVGSKLTAELSDDDGGVTGPTWQWGSDDAKGGPFTDISGATSASYTPVDDDAGKYLQASVSYDDAEGTGRMAMETTESMVTVTSATPLLDKFDDNDNRMIDRDEMFVAIDAYLFGEGDAAISKEDMFEGNHTCTSLANLRGSPSRQDQEGLGLIGERHHLV